MTALRPEAEVLLNLKDQGLDAAFNEYLWGLFVCLFVFKVARDNRK